MTDIATAPDGLAPIVKLAIGVAASGLIAAAAYGLMRTALLADLGGRTAAIMVANGITDGSAIWTTDAGWTVRIARLSGTADAATRRRTLAGVAALAGVHDAVWHAREPLSDRSDPFVVGGCNGRINTYIADHAVNFEAGGSKLDAGSNATLDAIVTILGSCPSARISVMGHMGRADDVMGTLALSQARADAVAAGLARRGIDPRQIEAIGMGARYPIDRGKTGSADRRNNRIELRITGDPADSNAQTTATKTGAKG